MHFFNPFSSFFYDHVVLSYCVLFFFVIVEGEIAVIIGAIFVHLGILSMPVTLMLIALAAVIKTILGYKLGSYLGEKFPNSHLLKYFERKVLYFLPHFREKPFWSIVLSKFIYGVNNAALVVAGFIGANYKKYFMAEMVSSLIWLGALFGLGYFFAAKAFAITSNFKNFSLVILLFIIGFMVLQKIINLIIELGEEWDTDREAKN
ncbi:MAG: VTT domain-containing protein [Candidatus Pacebacteria bacterium]|nr:VTT domain-containing protein [Candidatus Paceibacterota bacterium]